MYRLLTLRSFTQKNFKLLPSLSVILPTEIKCYRKTFTVSGDSNKIMFSNQIGNHSISRRQLTTTPHTELLRLIKKKKKRFRSKKFTELLQVTELSTKETKTSIQKLKANKLSEFIDKQETLNLQSQTNNNSLNKSLPSLEYNKYNLDLLNNTELHDKLFDETPVLFIGKNVDSVKISRGTEILREIMESYQAFKEMSLNEELSNRSHVDPIDLITSNSLPLIPNDSRFMDEEMEPLEEESLDLLDVNENILHGKIQTGKKDKTKTKCKFKSKYHKSPELERLAKQQSLAANLSAYLDLCVNSGLVNRGLAAIYNYRSKYKKLDSSVNIVDIKLYNTLMSGYAAKANLGKIREILNILLEDKINCTPQTYAAIFECIGRQTDKTDIHKLLEKFYAESLSKGITLNDIMDKSIFIGDQREIVLEQIKKIDKNFEPNYTPPILTYTNKLLNSLNHDVQPIENNNPTTNNIIMNSKRGFTVDQLHNYAEEQLKLELKGEIIVKSIEKFPDVTDSVLHYRKKLEEIQDLWRTQICAAFNRDMNTLRHQTQSKSSRSINLFPYLRALNINQYADILLREIRVLAEGSETYSPTVGQLYRELGQKALAKYQMEIKKQNGVLEKTGEIYGLYCENISECNTNDNPRQTWQRLVHKNRINGPSMDFNEKNWPMTVMIGVGRFLYNILMRDLKIDVNIIRMNSKNQNQMAAFYTLFRNQGRIVKEEVKPHPVLSRLYRGSQQQTLIFDTNMVPMLCPPQPWSTTVNGGYLLAKSDLIRLPSQAIQQWARINDASITELYPSLDSLNQLSSVPWKINKNLLDVILEVFNNGGSSKLDVPQPSSSLKTPDYPTNTQLTKEEKFQIFRQKLVHRRKQAEMYSLWCDTLYRLSLANHYRDKIFWLPHNMDFRGRVYPIPPHLNHLGSDLARSLLIFHQEQPLGPDGFNWLKLHCINLTGTKKRDSLIERLLYAEEIMDDILDSARNPLSGRMWWTKSDEPWQTLSCCMEILKVTESKDPEKYMSSFPIHQDGSCNGLQHYAALGRDTSGAISVNLTPSEIPQDVYNTVAILVEKTRKKDADDGLEIAQILNNFIKRKVIKQTVMTTVYGVTRYGARLQIARQLKDIDNFPKEWVWPASTYLTAKTFESLREMFTSTKEIQDWFTDCARLISAVCGQNVEWVTPLGLPVVQPYNRFDRKQISKTNRIVEHISMDLYEKPNIMKQKNAFPPNFIHSLDSCHMMLTSLNCEKAGLTFISVHDCFWTHPCTVAKMNEICRKQFVALHSEPILEDLSAFLIEKYSYKEKDLSDDGSVKDLTKRKLNKILTQLPDKGDFDLKKILKSIYFFS